MLDDVRGLRATNMDRRHAGTDRGSCEMTDGRGRRTRGVVLAAALVVPVTTLTAAPEAGDRHPPVEIAYPPDAFLPHGGRVLEVLGGYRNETEPDKGLPMVINRDAHVAFVGYTSMATVYEQAVEETWKGATAMDVPWTVLSLEDKRGLALALAESGGGRTWRWPPSITSSRGAARKASGSWSALARRGRRSGRPSGSRTPEGRHDAGGARSPRRESPRRGRNCTAPPKTRSQGSPRGGLPPADAG